MEPLENVAKFMFVQACGVIPFIGPTAAAIAQSIISLAETAQHNKKACQYLSERVQHSLKLIVQSKSTSQPVVQSQKDYEIVLNEIKSYTVEINKTEKFSIKVKTWLMKLANADSMAEASKQLIQRLDDATHDFIDSMIIDNNNKLAEIKKKMDAIVITHKADEDENEAAWKIVVAQKADEDLTKGEIADLTIDISRLKNDDDDNIEFHDQNIQKRSYCGDKVAVKRILTEELKSEQEKIAKQAKIVRLLGVCNQIEKFYGVYTDYEVNGREYLFVVTEWMANGSLKEYFYKNKSIPWETKIKIAKQIAKGLNFCSSAGVYHRDVRSKNVLLDGNLNAKLTNFEMSRKIGGQSKEMPLESLRWTAPEKINFPKQPYTDKCEVYSFAILLWEISSHQLPFGDTDSPIKAGKKAVSKERPAPFLEDTPEPYKRLVEIAWHHNPTKRPSIDEMQEKLGRMENKDCSITSLPETPALEDLENSPLTQLPIDEIVSLHKKKRFKEAFIQFQQLAEAGNLLASYYAGLYLYEGSRYGIEKDEIRALQLLQKSADGGIAQGRFMYAYACLKGSYYSPEEGLKYLTKAALVDNYPDALYMVSQLFLNGEHGRPIDNNKYKKYLTMAADKGSEEAKRELATLE